MMLIALLVTSMLTAVTLVTPTATASRYGTDTDAGTVDASFLGEDSGDLAGIVSGVGDVNGDGFEDFVIAAREDEEGGYRAGQTYLVLGRSKGWKMDTDLSTADASFIGESANDYTGTSVTGVGDVNDDGFDDFTISSVWNDEAGVDAGQVYLIFGKASGWKMDTDLSQADASFLGEKAGDNAGRGISGVGDVNGDGIDDLLIGAHLNDASISNAGKTYLFFGKRTGWAKDTSLSKADASFQGENIDDMSGYSLGGYGDVNGDGYGDILIGAFTNGEGGMDSGQTYLILGKSSGWAENTSLANADASFIGEKQGDYSGIHVDMAGDVNGDGYDDILIGAQWNDENGANSGQSYLIMGKMSGWSMDTELSTSDASFLGEAAGDWSGAWCAGAGDVDGDGYDDIIIGAPFNDDVASDAGQAYFVLGKSTGWVMDTSLSNATASFIGESSGDQLGQYVDGAGDVNGDGYDDILIGAWSNDEGSSNAGQAYLIFYDLNVTDSDDDGYTDRLDAFPLNPFEHKDTDGDGMGDNLDPDADGDGTPDERDAFPLDKSESRDTDSDGIGDNADADDDNDGVNDTKDAFPLNPFEFADADKDGIGDNLDPDDDNDDKTDEEEMRTAIRRDMARITTMATTVQASLNADLAGLNHSLHASLSKLDADFLAELEGLDSALASDIQSALRSISRSMDSFNATVTGDITDLRGWLDSTLTALGVQLSGMNSTLNSQMDGMESRTEDLFGSLSDDLYLLMVGLARIEGDLGEEDADIIADIKALSEMTADLEEHTLTELGAVIDRLAANVSKYDSGTAANLEALSAEIVAFRTGTDEDVEGVNETLRNLAKLATILSELEALNASLAEAQSQLDATVTEASDDQGSQSGLNMVLIVIAMALMAVIILLVFSSRSGRGRPVYRSSRAEDIIVSVDDVDEGGA